jgi:hypothetical protein
MKTGFHCSNSVLFIQNFYVKKQFLKNKCHGVFIHHDICRL